MSDPKRNAAIFYMPDAFDPKKGLNGRRMVGQSFLKGFFDYADVDEYIAFANTKGRLDNFNQLAQSRGVSKPVRKVLSSAPEQLGPSGTVYISTPNYHQQTWQRQHFGMESYSLCGITHTISSTAVMEGVYNLRASPQAEWDAIICTSHAVHSAMEYQFECADDFLMHRFGSVPPRPQLPVVPLGINSADFHQKSDLLRAYRQEMGWTEDDIIVSIVARLSPYTKFDPLPLYIALQQSLQALGNKKKLHMVACGFYSDTHSQIVFKQGAAALMPDVSYHY